MKKKTIGKQLLAWVLAGAMMPQSSIAYAAETAASALGPKEDILVRWVPEKDQIKAGEEGKVFNRPCHSKSRSDITQACCNRSHIRNKVEIIQRNQHERPQQNEHIQNNKPCHAANRILIHLIAVQFNQVNRARVHNMADLPPNHFQKDYKTRNLNTARS